MDYVTLAIAYLIVALTIALSSLIISIHRSDVAYRWFALAFFTSAVGTLLLATVGSIEPFTGYVLANTLTIGTFPIILIGLKVHFKVKPIWLSRHSYYGIAFVVLFTIFAVLFPSYMIRSMIYSAVLIAVLVDMFLFLAAQLEHSAKLVKLLFLTLIGGYIAATLVRVTLVVVQGILDQIDFYETSVTSFILIVSIVFSILWFTVIQLFASESIQDVLSAKEAEITKLVQTDQLTGLWNRSYFEEELSALIEKAIEEEHQLSLIHLDIDHFKDLNERFGHAIGDQVLKEVVAIIRQTLSAKTPLIRWGGQEIMILSYTTAEESVKKAEVLRHNIANNNFTHFESVTASFGVAGYRENEAIDLWFKRVEMALREAKQSGRNCVIKGPK